MHPDCAPLAWMLGSWAGAGVVGYPSMESRHFGQEIDVTHDGRPFFMWTARAWLLDADGNRERAAAVETGFWRPLPDGEVELLLSHPTGIVEMYHGTAGDARVEVRTEQVTRSPHAKEYTAAHRMYGYVGGNMMWVMDMAATGHPLQSHASAELKRV